MDTQDGMLEEFFDGQTGSLDTNTPKKPQETRLKPILGTFGKGKKEPFSRWFPYLEGYDIDFVKTIVGKYLDGAELILDPFGGTITTGFACAEMEIPSFYCEVNPVLQFIAEVKGKVRVLTRKERTTISKEMVDLKADLADLIQSHSPDLDLRDNYFRSIFTKKYHFDRGIFEAILRTRSTIASLRQDNPLLADLLCVATLSCLVDASRLKRAGDLRFIKGYKERSAEQYFAILSQKLRDMAADINNRDRSLILLPQLITANAKDLGTIPYLGLDGVITSPPYMNGTNYFRNTKLELWFLGILKDSNDLRLLRRNALTAGINTVAGVYSMPAIEEIVDKIEEMKENEYDSRLHRMIMGYFSELHQIFSKIYHHLKDDGVVAIDIGDSIYAGVHIPSDRFLALLMQQIGFDLVNEIDIRTRSSNNGDKLKQVLLVFKK